VNFIQAGSSSKIDCGVEKPEDFLAAFSKQVIAAASKV
jgi:hypothetical protein